MTEILAKKLLYQSKNRGCKETDLILGSFAQQYLDSMSQSELEEYQRILALYDGDLYNYFTGKMAPPPQFHGPVMSKLLQFKLVEGNGTT